MITDGTTHKLYMQELEAYEFSEKANKKREERNKMYESKFASIDETVDPETVTSKIINIAAKDKQSATAYAIEYNIMRERYSSAYLLRKMEQRYNIQTP